MRKNSIKNTRINSEVQKELSEIISRELKDPRIHPMTTVVSVEVTPDLKFCKAYISVLGSEEAGKDTVQGLKECGQLHTHPAGQKNQFEKYSGTQLHPGSVDRVRRQYDETD